MLSSIDLSIFYLLYELSYGPYGAVIYVIAEKAVYAVLALVLYFGFRAFQRGEFEVLYGYAGALFSAVLARGVLTEVIRYFYNRPRPYEALDLWPLFQNAAYSFPSGHTTFIFALAVGVWYVHRPLAYVLAALGLLIGLARVASGVHYPSDIVGGAVVGTFVAVLVRTLYIRYANRGKTV